MDITQAAQVHVDAHTVISYHHTWLIWLLFLIGEALHIAVQVDDIARKNKMARKLVFTEIGFRFANRAFWCAMIFLLIWQYPECISAIVRIFHPIGPDEAEVLAIPMNNAVAGLYGLALDSLLNYIPGLKSQLPSIETA